MDEIWRDIEGFEGLYQVSFTGKVRSLHFNHSNQIKEIKTFDNDGYDRVVLTAADKSRHKFLVHRLVASAFISNNIGKSEVNHIDGNKRNNCVFNLEWATRKENINHAIKTNLRPANCIYTHPKRGESKCAKKVYQYSLDNKLIRVWPCALDAAEALGYHLGSIQRCCRGERDSHHNFKWSYSLVQ